mmetsp:Transcript_36691/g.91917  ORF Transcript_36691/g.91917 Transcript_36691/m.91917 type:complete len:215 (-) Transcript_36691:208-852(-)
MTFHPPPDPTPTTCSSTHPSIHPFIHPCSTTRPPVRPSFVSHPGWSCRRWFSVPPGLQPLEQPLLLRPQPGVLGYQCPPAQHIRRGLLDVPRPPLPQGQPPHDARPVTQTLIDVRIAAKFGRPMVLDVPLGEEGAGAVEAAHLAAGEEEEGGERLDAQPVTQLPVGLGRHAVELGHTDVLDPSLHVETTQTLGQGGKTLAIAAPGCIEEDHQVF